MYNFETFAKNNYTNIVEINFALDKQYLHIFNLVIKYLKGGNMSKLQEASRNELLALTKSQTVTRYNKAEEYKGFSIRDIKTDETVNNNFKANNP